MNKLTLDNNRQIFFYEQEFYPFSNFSSFNLQWKGLTFPTSEHAYHWEKFAPHYTALRDELQVAPSAHEAYKLAERNLHCRREDWGSVKVGIMYEIISAKFDQHEYVRKKLEESCGCELIENSWRDDFWGWGPNRDGRNMLGKLWMRLRTEKFGLKSVQAREVDVEEYVFQAWWESEPHRAKYDVNHPAYLAARETWTHLRSQQATTFNAKFKAFLQEFIAYEYNPYEGGNQSKKYHEARELLGYL